jgi:cysteine desulfurase
LWIRKGVRVLPMFRGGGQQGGLRSGTEPTALIAAFGAAASCPQPDYRPLHAHLTAELRRLNLPIHGGGVTDTCVPNIVNFSCSPHGAGGVKSEVMLHFLAEHGIYVSSGSACARGKKSKILAAYGVSDRDIDTAIRVSFGWQNTVEEADKFLEVLETGIKRWVK